MLFLHAIHGCDTTSRLPLVRINKLLKLLHDQDFLKCAAHFQMPTADRETIIRNGNMSLVLLYGGKSNQSLEDLRVKRFLDKCKSHSEFIDIKNYPPTSDSAGFHVLRIFLQVMTWRGVILNPLEWGFFFRDGMMLPVMSTSLVAPKRVLDKISCGCKAGCLRRCSCRAFGIECNANCKKCIENCTNKVQHEDDFDEN